MTVLIFPSSHSAALDYYYQATSDGKEVIAASSLSYDDTAGNYKIWEKLPTIYADDFAEEFLNLIKKHNVDKVFSPSNQVYEFLQKFLTERNLETGLIGAVPAESTTGYYKFLLQQAENSKEFINEVSDNKSTISAIELASILRESTLIYGHSHQSKVLAMIGIFASAPKGDVVEIGSYIGRTAFILNFLSNHYNIGPVLTVDPWLMEEAIQKDSTEALQQTDKSLDWNASFLAFRINLIPFAQRVSQNTRKNAGENPKFNYLRTTSEKAESIYTSGDFIESEEFGKTVYSKKISVIHIDGNHDFKAVSLDYKLWRKHVMPGGWIILDDYIWSHGDGPKKVGDQVLAEESIERAFFAGNALFIKIAES